MLQSMGSQRVGHYRATELNWISLFLELFLYSSPVAYWAPTNPGEFLFQCHIFLPFHTVHEVLKARIPKWFAIPFSSGPCFVLTLYHDPPMVLHGMAHSFIELDKAVIHVGLPWWLRRSVYNAGDPGLSPALGKSPGEGNGNPLQYYCLENPMWSMWSVWLVFCDCDFHSFCPLKYKRLVEVSWCKGLTVGESESFSEVQGHAQ